MLISALFILFESASAVNQAGAVYRFVFLRAVEYESPPIRVSADRAVTKLAPRWWAQQMMDWTSKPPAKACRYLTERPHAR